MGRCQLGKPASTYEGEKVGMGAADRLEIRVTPMLETLETT
jgi:hypothetical protein